MRLPAGAGGGRRSGQAHPKRLINGHYKINRMGFGRQQRLNAVDTDKYSHFGEKCTFIGTQNVKA